MRNERKFFNARAKQRQQQDPLGMFLISGFGSTWLVLGFIIAVVGGLVNANKVRKTLNGKD